MTLYEYHIVYPEGDRREIEHPLTVSDVVDINGTPLPLPLPTNRMIAYHGAGKRTQEERGVVATWYLLELLSAEELRQFL